MCIIRVIYIPTFYIKLIKDLRFAIALENF